MFGGIKIDVKPTAEAADMVGARQYGVVLPENADAEYLQTLMDNLHNRILDMLTLEGFIPGPEPERADELE